MVRTGAVIVALLGPALAIAQPAPTDPYGPSPSPSPPPSPPPSPSPSPTPPPSEQDPALAEPIAAHLVERAQELFEQRMYADAKQLAVEALVASPKGPSANRARALIKAVNQLLGIQAEPTTPPPTPEPPNPNPPSPTPPTTEPPTPVAEPAPLPSVEGHSGTTAARVHGALYGGVLGATIGSVFDTDKPAAGAVPVGIVGGLAGAWFAPKLFARWRWDEAQVRTIGAGSLWGGVIGGAITEVVTGAGDSSPSAPGILVGTSIGATAGAVAGGVLARDHRFTRGDIALTDTLAGIGAVGGLTVGMLMQPAQKEAYSLNVVLGAAGGVIAGYVAAPQTNTTQRRMLRVAGLAAAGGGLPFLLYAGIHDPSSHADERVTGALSTLGLVGGAWLGFYLTRHMDVGKDDVEGDAHKAKPDDAPPATVMRSSDGEWQLGGIALQPLSPELAPQKGMALTLLGGAW